MPCCPAVIDLWRDTLLDFPQVSDPDALFLIRALIMDLIQDTNISIEEALLESFYILSELAKNAPITIAKVTEYFSPASLAELRAAIHDVELPAADTWMECNELLQDLSVNYIEESLYASYLNPLITLAEQFTVPDDVILAAFQRQLHTYDILFRNYVANEIFSDLLCRRIRLTICCYISNGLPWNMHPSGRAFFFFTLPKERIIFLMKPSVTTL